MSSWSTIKNAKKPDERETRHCIFCHGEVEQNLGVISVNRKFGYGLIGMAHFECTVRFVSI